MDDAKLRAWWFHRQGLDGSMTNSSVHKVLAATGWGRSVAGSGPYLTFFSRAGLSRDAVDTAVANLEIHELPSARGCTYILPASDFALGLRVGEQFSGGEMTLARKLGVTDSEVTKLCSAVLDSLRKSPLSPDEIHDVTGSTSRSLGPEGAKKGLTSTLPLALGSLQASGQIRRIPINGRLDQQRYRYALWKPSPMDNFRLSVADSYTELARRYFRWIGPATLPEFQWFSDPESSSIAWFSFGTADNPMRQCVSRTEAYIREQLGDARSFSLDSPKSRAPRIKALRDEQKTRK